MNSNSRITDKRIRLKRKIRARISGSDSRPRLTVYRSNKFIYGQIINDDKGVTLVEASDMKVKKGTKTERAITVGQDIAKKAQAKSITTVVFDRNGFNYTGRVKALADAARAAGLVF